MKRKHFGVALALCLLLYIASAFAANTAVPSQIASQPAPDGSAQPGQPDNGIRILVPNTAHRVLDVWKEGDNFQVLIEEELPQNSSQLHISENLHLEEGASLLFRAWHDFSNGSVGDYTNNPPYSPSFWREFEPAWLLNDEHDINGILNNPLWQVTWKDYLVRSGIANDAEETAGLWLIGENQEPVFVHSGSYAKPLVIPDSNEVIVTKFREGEGIPYALIVSVNLDTFEETHLLNAFPGSLTAWAYLDGKLLVKLSSNDAPDAVVYAMADLTTLEILQINPSIGDALSQTRLQPLQSTGNPGEYYLSVANYFDTPSRNSCTIGRFNVHDLTFEYMTTLQGVILDGSATWVDAENQIIYSCYNGDLVSIPYEEP